MCTGRGSYHKWLCQFSPPAWHKTCMYRFIFWKTCFERDVPTTTSGSSRAANIVVMTFIPFKHAFGQCQDARGLKWKKWGGGNGHPLNQSVICEKVDQVFSTSKVIAPTSTAGNVRQSRHFQQMWWKRLMAVHNQTNEMCLFGFCRFTSCNDATWQK